MTNSKTHISCSRCARSLEDIFEQQEAHHVFTHAGYGSVFGDDNLIEGTFCQHCIKELLGRWLRVTCADRQTDDEVDPNQWLGALQRAGISPVALQFKSSKERNKAGYLPSIVATQKSVKNAEEDRLRSAVLHLAVEDIGLTVDEALQELCDLIDSEEDSDYARFIILRKSLSQIGLEFSGAPPHLNLESEGYLMLRHPDLLLAWRPELAPLHPEAHALITLGTLPRTAQVVSVLQTSGSAKLYSVRSWQPQQHMNRSAQQASRLRQAILALRLDAGPTVKETLEELCRTTEPTTDDELDRIDDLHRDLRTIGLEFTEADPTGSHTAHITLAHPDWLLRLHPELAALHPSTRPAMKIT